MMLKIDTTPKLFTPTKAEEVVEQLNDGDEDWSYVVDHDPKGTGYSRVKVYDEDGELVGFI